MKGKQVLLGAAAAALVATSGMALGDPPPKRPPTPGVVVQLAGIIGTGARSRLDPAAPPTIRD